MEEERRTALPWYCAKCGMEHDPSRKILMCANGACRAKDFVMKVTQVAWPKLVSKNDERFLKSLKIDGLGEP